MSTNRGIYDDNNYKVSVTPAGVEHIANFANSKAYIKSKEFKIDFELVKEMEDIISILKALDISFWQYTESISEERKSLMRSGILKEVAPIAP